MNQPIPTINATEVIKWSYDRPDIVTVGEDGLVKGLKEGEAVITTSSSKGERSVGVQVAD